MIASWQESYDKPRYCIKKQRYHFAHKGPYSQGYGLSISHVCIWELDHDESRTLKNWCFRAVVLEKTLQSLLDSKETNQSILKEINREYSLEGQILKLKLQYIGHLMQREDSLEKTLMLGKTEGRRRRGWQKMRWLDGITDSIDMNLGKFWEMVRDKEPGMFAVHATKISH